MNPGVLGGLLKIAAAGTIAWAWYSGNLGNTINQITAALSQGAGYQRGSVARPSSTGSSSSSSNGAIA